MLSPNYVKRRVKKGGGAHGPSLRVNLLNLKIKRKERLKRKILGNERELSSENYHWKLSSENYEWELSSEIYEWELSSENYYLVYHHAEKLRFIGILRIQKFRLYVFPSDFPGI